MIKKITTTITQVTEDNTPNIEFFKTIKYVTNNDMLKLKLQSTPSKERLIQGGMFSVEDNEGAASFYYTKLSNKTHKLCELDLINFSMFDISVLEEEEDESLKPLLTKYPYWEELKEYQKTLFNLKSSIVKYDPDWNTVEIRLKPWPKDDIKEYISPVYIASEGLLSTEDQARLDLLMMHVRERRAKSNDELVGLVIFDFENAYYPALETQYPEYPFWESWIDAWTYRNFNKIIS